MRSTYGRWIVTVSVAMALVLTSVACTKQRPAEPHLSAEPQQLADCGPKQLAPCVPRLADFDTNLFDGVSIYETEPGFAAVPPSAARESAPEECQHLPRFGSADGQELDVAYQPGTEANSFPRYGDFFRLRLTAGNGNDLKSAVDAWAHQCPMWRTADMLNDKGIRGWQIAESADALRRYQSGDTASQWPFVTHMAAAVLPNGVVGQVWYRTDDPSAKSRINVLSQVLAAVGRPRPRSALPPQLADWSPAQVSTLLPPLAMNVAINLPSTDNEARTDSPGGQFWSLCPANDRGSTPRYDPEASWHDFDQSKWDQPGRPLRPKVTISRAHAGDDFLAEVRRELADCNVRLAEQPAVCTGRENRQFLQSDSAVIEGEEAIRLTHRWMREGEIRGSAACSEGVEAIRVTEVRGLIVVASSRQGGPGFRGDAPSLPLDTLDELLADTVRSIKAI